MYRFFESIIHPALEVLQPRTIIEIGIDEGLHTQRLLTFCETHGATLHAIDPEPHCDIAQMQRTYGDHFVFHRDLSLNALYRIERYDTVLIDGDHNWYTVYHELLLIEKKIKKPSSPFPLVFLHDIGWPYGRRDLYYNPETIPPLYRQPFVKKGIDPRSHTLVDDGGLNSDLHHAIYEHHIHNGVLTAVEDFLAQSPHQLHFQSVPGFSGLGILIPQALLTAHPPLAAFLAQLGTTPPIAQHIASLEDEHLRHTASLQQERNCQREMTQELTILRGNQQKGEGELARARESMELLRRELTQRTEEYRHTLQAKEEDMHHTLQTRSWRWTAPIRMGESIVRRLSSSPTHTTIRLLRRLWTALGSIFLQAACHIRHDILAPAPAASPKILSHITSHDHRAAALVVCHNPVSLLPKTIESLLAQTDKFSDILTIDDDSSDETRRIALEYASRGIEYLSGSWHNEHAANNAGLRNTECPLLVFLRAGDTLPPEYLSHCQAAFREHPDAAIVYPKAHTTTPDPFDPEYFERDNYLPDCSAVRRTALLEVGGWNHGLGAHATWITWRRILANGWKAVKVPSVIFPPSPTAVGEGTGERAMERLRPPVDPLPQPLPLCERGGENIAPHSCPSPLSPLLDATLCLSLSGRAWMWPLTREFLEQQTYPHARTHLVIIDTSQESAFGYTVQAWLLHSDYGKHTYIPLSVGLKGLADLPRRIVPREVAAACAQIYQHFAHLCTTPWVFFLEDDIIPPSDVYPRLLTHFSDRTASVSALCMQRNGPHPIAWEWDSEGLPTEPIHQTGVTAIGGNGFCCVALRGEYVRNGKFHCGPGNSCHDHNFYRSVVCEQGLQALLDWSCVCQHYVAPGEWRVPLPSPLPPALTPAVVQ